MLNKNFYIFIFFIVMFFSCSGNKNIKPFDSESITDKENNDTFNQANEVSTQTQIIGFLSSKNNSTDKDYYKVFFALRGVTYKIIQTAIPGVDTRITFYSPDKTRILSVDSGRKGEAEKIWEFNPQSNFIYMLVESKSGNNEKVPYIIEFMPLIDESTLEQEPNNDKEHATDIRIGEEKKGLISPESDVDFYRVVLDPNQNEDFSIELETLSNHDIGFTVINENLDKVKFINNYSWGEKESLPFIGTNKGKIFIKVTMNLNPNDNSSPMYTLKVNKASALFTEKNPNLLFEKEFNDTKETATDLVSGKTMIGAFFPSGDEDWFKFDIGYFNRNINLSLSRIRNINSKIELYNSSMQLIAKSGSSKSGEQEEILLSGLDKGTYYAKLTADDKSLVVYKLFFSAK